MTPNQAQSLARLVGVFNGETLAYTDVRPLSDTKPRLSWDEFVFLAVEAGETGEEMLRVLLKQFLQSSKGRHGADDFVHELVYLLIRQEKQIQALMGRGNESDQ